MREACSLASVMDEVTGTFQGLLVRKEIDLKVDVAQVAEKVMVDSRSLFRCILNLVTNAAHACPKEGGCIEVGAQLDGEGALYIEVGDNGPGIPEDERERIFEPFYSTKGSNGTGLGLSVTRKAVLEHGGVISVGESRMGGALFRIVLPAVTKES